MTLPTAPSRTMDQDAFDAAVEAFVGALPTFETDMNALAAAMSLNATTDTSASSNSIGTGAKTFTVSASKSFWPGMWLVIADTAAPTTNAMFCQVTSYSGTTLIVNSHAVQGSGTKTSWQISQSAPAALGSLYASTAGATFTGLVNFAAGVNIASAATFTGLVNFAAGANIASAATVDLTAATGNSPRITGTVATSAVTMNTGQWALVVADGAWPLTYHATTNKLNGGASYTCSAGDMVLYNKDLSGVVHGFIIKADGTAVVGGTVAATDYQVFTGGGTWTKPSGTTGDELVLVELWAGGGGGYTGAGAGGGGAYMSRTFKMSALGATETVTIGAGGTGSGAPTAGGNSSFGSLLNAYGGAQGSATYDGAGGGSLGAGSGQTGGLGYQSLAGAAPTTNAVDGGGGGSPGTTGGCSFYGGAGGGTTTAGKSVYGGGGGGAGAGGASLFGGAGGASGVAGTAPAGGGGRGANGARGECRVTVIRS